MTDHHDALDRYLDDLANGRAPRDELDPGLVATIDRISEIGETPVPDRTFVDQLEDTLMNAASAAPALPRLTAIPERPLPQPLPVRPTVPVAGLRRWAPILISAALLLLTLGVAFGPLRPGNDDPGRGPAVPAAMVQASPSPEADGENVLLEIPLPAEVVPPDGVGDVGMNFSMMAPGSTAAFTSEMSDEHPGIWVHYIVSGAMTLTAENAVNVIRAEGSQETIPAGTEIALEAGDATLHGVSKELQWTNAGSAEVQIITLNVAWDYFVVPPIPPHHQWEMLHSQFEGFAAIPAGDWVIRLVGHEVEPEGVIPAPEQPTVQFGLTSADTDAYTVRGVGGELTLHAAETVTPVYVFTLEQTSPAEASPEA